MHYVSRRLLTALITGATLLSTQPKMSGNAVQNQHQEIKIRYNTNYLDQLFSPSYFSQERENYTAEKPKAEPPQRKPVRLWYIPHRMEAERNEKRKFLVTAYTPCDPRMSCRGITASGEPARIGIIAADKSMPFGTLIYFPALDYRREEARRMPKPVYRFLVKHKLAGIVKVMDRGGAIKGRKIDFFVGWDRNFAFKFGKRKLHGYIIKNE